MAQTVQVKRGTTAAWSAGTDDTKLRPGQFGIEYVGSGYSRLKVGLDNQEQSPTAWEAAKYLVPDIRTYGDNALNGSSSFTANLPNLNSQNLNPILHMSGSIGIGSKTWAAANIYSVTSNMMLSDGREDSTLGSESTPWDFGYVSELQASTLTTQSIKPKDTSEVSIYTASSSTLNSTQIRFAADAIYPYTSNYVNLGSPNGYIWKGVYANAFYTRSGSSNYKIPTFFRGTGSPSGGSDGDIYIQYIN